MDDHELAARLATRCNALEADNAALRVIAQAVVAHVNESLTDIAQSVLESGGLPPEHFPLDHARVTIVSIERRLTQARALLADTLAKDGGHE